jgi:hypothetical protein
MNDMFKSVSHFGAWMRQCTFFLFRPTGSEQTAYPGRPGFLSSELTSHCWQFWCLTVAAHSSAAASPVLTCLGRTGLVRLHQTAASAAANPAPRILKVCMTLALIMEYLSGFRAFVCAPSSAVCTRSSPPCQNFWQLLATSNCKSFESQWDSSPAACATEAAAVRLSLGRRCQLFR